MQFDPQAGVTKNADGDQGRRRRGRLGQEAVVSSVGTVLDLSSTGMRVRCGRLPRGEFDVQIRGLGSEITVRVRVAWIRKFGMFRREAGLEFVDLTPGQAEKVTQLGMTNRRRLTI